MTMNKFSALGFAFLATEAAMAASPALAADRVKPMAAEVAIYKVKEGYPYDMAHKEAMDVVKAMPGYQDGVSMKNADGSLYADILFWDTLEQAEQAAKSFETQSRFDPMRKGISEIVVYRHYAVDYDKTQFDRFFEEGAALEIAASKVKDLKVQAESASKVYAKLPQMDGFKAHFALTPADGEDLHHIDFIAWDSVQKAEAFAQSHNGRSYA